MQMVQLNQEVLDFLGKGTPNREKGPPYNFNTDLQYAYHNQFNTTVKMFWFVLYFTMHFYKGGLDQDWMTRVMGSSVC